MVTNEIGEPLTYKDAKVKAIIVVNIKQDDPAARKTIPELISLAAKYGRGSDYELAVVACPTDQGYYEPDTSQLLKLKLASEYGYGINPSTVVTDKVNLLGTGAVPFWRWLQNTCRTPAGLGRVEGNFEKFLIDGRTGLPVRRYPRKYRRTTIAAGPSGLPRRVAHGGGRS
jgi:glutathione peroxidase-family protein